jgi:2-haloalkanoic acid dehalogenase type II
MGTCCDWLSSLLPLLHSCPPHPSIQGSGARDFAIVWREAFFVELHARFDRGEPAEDIDLTHRRVLDQLLRNRGIGHEWDDTVRDRLVQQWHVQSPWPDVLPALHELRKDKEWFLIVLANGTTRLQLDVSQSSAIPFHMLMSSELLGLTKPDLAIYRRAMELVQLPPESCIMIASHLYDLKAAKAAGMHTIYIHRPTEDVDIDIMLDGEHSFVDSYFDARSNDIGPEVFGFLGAARYLKNKFQ